MPKWTGGSIHKSHFHPGRNWVFQWNRVVRWKERLKTISVDLKTRDLSQDDVDFMIAFFQTCYHMRDWLSASIPDLKSEVDRLFQESFELQVLRDVCNGTKHCDINRPSIDADFSLVREYDHLSGHEGFAAQRYWLLFGEHEIQKIDVFEFAEKCFVTIRDFLKISVTLENEE
ncbi:MAG: hypothetical protein JNM39_09700 [Bdellovibrionaceae bacterium]|nr:hypothetical protein [Pseudobdellovibrionaceae bacterium]